MYQYCFKIFIVTGGLYTSTTEILKDKTWTALPSDGNIGNSAGIYGIYGLSLATIDNEVFSFGKMQK